MPTLTKRIRDSCRICAVPSWPMREKEKERKIDRERERKREQIFVCKVERADVL